jgi:hypothetical protein
MGRKLLEHSKKVENWRGKTKRYQNTSPEIKGKSYEGTQGFAQN